jgi:hypothetical protein
MEGTTDVAMTTKIPSFTDGTCLALCTVPRWTASGSGWVGSVRWPHLPMDAALAGWRSENGGWGLTGCWIRGPVWSWRGRTWADCRASWGVISRTDYPDTLPGQPRGTKGGGGEDARLRMETPRAMADLETADHYCRYLLRLTAAGGNRDPKTEQAPLAIERTGLHFATEQAPERTRLSQLL